MREHAETCSALSRAWAVLLDDSIACKTKAQPWVAPSLLGTALVFPQQLQNSKDPPTWQYKGVGCSSALIRNKQQCGCALGEIKAKCSWDPQVEHVFRGGITIYTRAVHLELDLQICPGRASVEFVPRADESKHPVLSRKISELLHIQNAVGLDASCISAANFQPHT